MLAIRDVVCKSPLNDRVAWVRACDPIGNSAIENETTEPPSIDGFERTQLFFFVQKIVLFHPKVNVQRVENAIVPAIPAAPF